jgi:GrpB-like predicted nucleotidyltransferase (UPF0157 family)
VIRGSALWIRHLAFRDYLRAHPDAAAAYAQVKWDLAVHLAKDEYTAAKSAFIERVLSAAMGETARRSTDR